MQNITSTPSQTEVRSRAALLSKREPTREDILASKPERTTEQKKTLQSAYNVASKQGDTTSPTAQANMFASTMMGGAAPETFESGGQYATQEDIKKAYDTHSRLTAQFASEMLNDPIEGLINNLRGGREGKKKNIFQNYMAELSVAGIKDPRNKLRLLNDFKADVEGHVQEAKTTMFNRMRTQQLLLQDAWKKVEFMNQSRADGTANAKDLEKAKMEAEKHEMAMKMANAQYSNLTRTIKTTGDRNGDGIYDINNRQKLLEFEKIITSGESVLEWIKKNVETKKQATYTELYEEYMLLSDDEKVVALGLPPEEDVPKTKTLLQRIFGGNDEVKKQPTSKETLQNVVRAFTPKPPVLGPELPKESFTERAKRVQASSMCRLN